MKRVLNTTIMFKGHLHPRSLSADAPPSMSQFPWHVFAIQRFFLIDHGVTGRPATGAYSTEELYSRADITDTVPYALAARTPAPSARARSCRRASASRTSRIGAKAEGAADGAGS